MWTFLELELKQKVEKIRLDAGRVASSHAFDAIFIWREEMQISIWLEQDGYMLRQSYGDTYRYFFPLGADETRKRMLSAIPPDATLRYATAEDLVFLSNWQPNRYHAEPARGDWEYLYSKEAQLTLPGKPYRQIRRSVDKARNLPDWHIQLLDAQSMHIARAVEEQWHELNLHRLGEADSQAAQNALDYFYPLGLVGVLAWVGEQPVGYALGTFLDDTTFLGMIQRALDPNYFSALRWELYNTLPSQIATLDLEDDMGREGVRQNKMLMRPDGFYEVWDIRLTEQEERNK